MSIKKIVPLVALVVGLGSAAIAPREAAAQDGRGQVCVYEHIDYGGYEQCFDAGEGIPNLGRFHDRISSVRIRGRIEVTLFEHNNFQGRQLTINSDVSDLRRFGGWNDQADSLRITSGGGRRDRDRDRDRNYGGGFGGGGYSGGRGEDRVCFYEHTNFQGRSECWDSGDDVSDLRGRGWNDRISSARIFGRTRVVLFEDINYGGQRIVIEGDTADFTQLFGDGRFSWNDRVSSFRISGGRGRY